MHTTAGYLLYAQMTVRHVFDFNPDDVFGCVADIGWITGHTYVTYGPLANGGATLCFDSHPLFPDAGRYWETCAKFNVTQFYGAPTAYRMLLRLDFKIFYSTKGFIFILGKFAIVISKI